MNQNAYQTLDSSMAVADTTQFDHSLSERQFKMLRLEDMPPFERQLTAPVDVQTYLESLLSQVFNPQLDQIFLPSLSVLGPFFNLSADTMRLVMKGLKNKGYDYFATGKYGLISIWPTA